jgi:hypothetical protein
VMCERREVERRDGEENERRREREEGGRKG